MTEWSTSAQRNTGIERNMNSFSNLQKEEVVRILKARSVCARYKNSLDGSSVGPNSKGKSEKCPVVEVIK